jgi:hypothetical protein
LWVDGLATHFAHQVGNALVIHFKTMLVVQPGYHFAVAIEWRPGIFLVNEPHQLQVKR